MGTMMTTVHPHHFRHPQTHLELQVLCLEWTISSAQALKGVIKARRAEATLQGISDMTLEQTQVMK